MPSEFTLDDFEEAPASEFSLSDFEEEPALRPEIGELRQAVTPPDLGAVPFAMGGVNAPPIFQASIATTVPSVVPPPEAFVPAIPRQPVSGELSTTFGGPPKPLASYAETMESLQESGTPISRIVAPRPIITEPRIDIPEVPIPKEAGFWNAAGREAVNAAASVPEFLSSDAGILAAMSAKLAPRLTSAGFSIDLFHSAFEQAKNLYKNWGKMTPAERGKASVDTLASLVLGGTTGAHAAGVKLPTRAKPVEEAKPEVAEVVPSKPTEAPADVTSRLETAIRNPEELKKGNALSSTLGLEVKSIEDLENLAKLHEKIAKENRALLDELQTLPPEERGPRSVELFSAALRNQLVRETAGVATDTAWVEGEGTIPTKLGPRPLDWKTNPEVADWLLKNADRLDLKLPDALKARAAKPAAVETAVAKANRPAVKLMPDAKGNIQKIPAELKPDGTWETHDEIIARNGLKTEDIDRRIFVDEQGNEKPREQTAQELAAAGVETKVPGEAHSTDLPPPKPPEPAPAAPTPSTSPTPTAKEPWQMTAVEARRAFPTLTQEKWDAAVTAAWKDGRLTEDSAPVQSMMRSKPRDFGEIDAVLNGRMEPSADLLKRHPDLAKPTPAPAAEKKGEAPENGKVVYRVPATGKSKTFIKWNGQWFKSKGGVTTGKPLDPNIGLTRALEAQLAKESQPTPPPGTQGLAKTVRQKWTGATDPTLGSEAGFVSLAPIQALIDRTSPYVKAVVDTIMAVGKHQLDIGKATDFRRSVFHWSAKLQRSFGEAASAQREIRTKVPDKTRREGITNWIQAGGDPTILASRRADTEAWRDPVTGKPHPQQKQLLAGYDAALHLTPEEIAVAQDVKRTYDELGNRGQTYDVLKTFKDNYVTQIWNLRRGPIPKGAGVGRSLMLKDRFRFAKASTFPTFFDGEQAGYIPRTKDIADILPLYMHEMNSVIAARQLVEQMAGGVGSDGRKLLAPRGVGMAVEGDRGKATLVMPDVPAEKTRDYVIIENQPALHEWRWVTKDAAGNPVFNKSDLMVHPEVADHFRNVLGRSAITEWYRSRTTASAEIPKAIARGLDFAQSETKRTMLGVLTPFHQVQEGTHAVGHRVNPFFNNPKIDLVNDAGQMDAAKHGLMLLPDRTSSQQFMEGFKQSALVTKIPVLGPLADHYSEYLFHQYIPGIKYKTYQAILQRNTHLYGKELTAGKATLEDIKILSAEQANAAYGHLNYADLGRNPTILHIMRLGLLAPDFLEARARFAGQAIKGVGGAKIGREQLVALATLALAQASLSYIMANITGGTWDEKDPFAFHVGNKKFTMRSVPEDAYRFAKDTRSFVYARLNPIIGRGAVQYASGVDWRGQKVTKARTTKELLTQPVPLFLRPLVGLGNTPLMAWEEIAAASGLKISRYSAVSEMYKVAHQWKADHPDPKVQRAEARYEASSFPDSDYKPLRESLIKNDMKGALTAYEELLKTGHPHKDIDNVMKPWTGGTVNKATGELTPRHPKAFTSAKLESRFVDSLTDEQKATYNRAIIERRELYNRFRTMLSQQQPKPKLASEFSLKDFE